MSMRALDAPTLPEAHEAAQLLIDEGVSRVLLFGSLARDAVDDDSDIDLVALYDDLGDYSTRSFLESELKRLCGNVIGKEVDILVTDFPEWERRVMNVSASVEASIAEGTVLLAGNQIDQHRIRWDKEIGMPPSNIDEALERLPNLTQHIQALWPPEVKQSATSMHTERSKHREQIKQCENAALAIENALKTLIRMAGGKAADTHHIDNLLKGLAEIDPKQHQASADLLADLKHARLPHHPNQHRDYSDISAWRQAGSYSADPEFRNIRGNPKIVEALVPILMSRALGIATHTYAQLVKAEATLPPNFPPLTQDRLDNLCELPQLIADVSDELHHKDKLANDHETYMSNHKLLSCVQTSPTATTDAFIGRVTAVTPDASDTSKLCGKRTKQDGRPCGRLLKLDGKCPYHG